MLSAGTNRCLRLERVTTIGGETQSSLTYDVISLTVDRANAATLQKILQSHWVIESFFWVKEAVMREDHSRIRSRRLPELTSMLIIWR